MARLPIHPLRTAGKVLLFTGVMLTGMALLGAWRPYSELKNAPYVQTKVLKNQFAYKTPNGYAFQLQMSWLMPDGEHREQITSNVIAGSEDEARRKYRGAHLEAGQSYDLPLDPADPTRVQPFLGFNWRTFGQFGILGLGGLIAFTLGMIVAKRGQRLERERAAKN